MINQRPYASYRTTFITALLLCCSTTDRAKLHADILTWDAPGIDVWTYPLPSTPGVRALGPTFLASPGLDESNQFLPSSSRDPARRGMSFAVFDTSLQIDTGFNPERYQINAVTVTFTMQESTAGFIYYDDTYDTNAELLSDYVTGNIDTVRPMELYGVGLQADYTGFDFSNGSGGEQPYSETIYPYSPPDGEGVLIAHPIATDATGEYVDVSNSLTGGYSATAPDNTTAPFDSTPWSIGTAAGLSPGDMIPDDTTFSFEIDINRPGVAEYIQGSLSVGELGFFLSSTHFVGDPHNGSTIPYPQWYLKEFNTAFGGVPPTLEVDYSLLPIPGDFDSDNDVDADDLAQWQDDYGSNGDSDGADFLAWQRNFTGTPSTSLAAIPEPSSTLLALLAMTLWAAVRHKTKNV